jgi:hypothetical protein
MSGEIAQASYEAKLDREFLQGCEGLTVEAVSPLPPALEVYAIECRPQYNGHLSAAYQFRITSPIAIQDWLCRSDIAERGFFRILFENKIIKKTIPDLGDILADGMDLGFRNKSAYIAYAELAINVRGGPCYPLIMPRRVQNDEQAFSLAKGFVDAASCQEMSDTWVWYSDQSWCSAVDAIQSDSYVWINPKQNLITVYLYSDAS